MTSLPTPNWILNEEHTVYVGGKDAKTLPEGTFARPIELDYVPDYIKASDSHKFFNSESHTYAYTPVGIVVVPRRKLSKI